MPLGISNEPLSEEGWTDFAVHRFPFSNCFFSCIQNKLHRLFAPVNSGAYSLKLNAIQSCVYFFYADWYTSTDDDCSKPICNVPVTCNQCSCARLHRIAGPVTLAGGESSRGELPTRSNLCGNLIWSRNPARGAFILLNSGKECQELI